MSNATEAIKYEDNTILTLEEYYRIALEENPDIQGRTPASILRLDEDGRIIEEITDTVDKNLLKYEIDLKINEERKKTESLTDEKQKTPKQEGKKKTTIKVEQRQRQTGDDYFLKIERGVIRNETYRKIFKGPSVVYEWLWANIVRNQWVDNKTYPIKEKYFSKGYLAYCSTYGKIAKDCGMSKNTVHRYIKDFNEAGIVKLEPYVPEGKKQGQTVFILGAWEKVDGEIIETYYRDKIFITPKSIKN